MVLAYITTKDKEEANTLGLHLVQNKLAACVNIIDGMKSLYWWEGKIESSEEAILIAKTEETLAKDLIAEVKKKHSYSCPCILILPINGGNSAYLKWLQDSLQ
jgi:periplasmic divalent cation tolerance protein